MNSPTQKPGLPRGVERVGGGVRRFIEARRGVTVGGWGRRRGRGGRGVPGPVPGLSRRPCPRSARAHVSRDRHARAPRFWLHTRTAARTRVRRLRTRAVARTRRARACVRFARARSCAANAAAAKAVAAAGGLVGGGHAPGGGRGHALLRRARACVCSRRGGRHAPLRRCVNVKEIHVPALALQLCLRRTSVLALPASRLIAPPLLQPPAPPGALAAL